MIPNIPEDKLSAMTNAILNGNKIEAIKICRESTNLSLKDSKEVADQLEATLRKDFPDQFAPGAVNKKGCSVALLLFGPVVLGPAVWVFWV